MRSVIERQRYTARVPVIDNNLSIRRTRALPRVRPKVLLEFSESRNVLNVGKIRMKIISTVVCISSQYLEQNRGKIFVLRTVAITKGYLPLVNNVYSIEHRIITRSRCNHAPVPFSLRYLRRSQAPFVAVRVGEPLANTVHHVLRGYDPGWSRKYSLVLKGIDTMGLD